MAEVVTLLKREEAEWKSGAGGSAALGAEGDLDAAGAGRGAVSLRTAN